MHIVIDIPFMIGDIVYRINPCQNYIGAEIVEAIGFDKVGVFIETDSAKYRKEHIDRLVFVSYDDARSKIKTEEW